MNLLLKSIVFCLGVVLLGLNGPLFSRNTHENIKELTGADHTPMKINCITPVCNAPVVLNLDFTVRPFDSHVELAWDATSYSDFQTIRVYYSSSRNGVYQVLDSYYDISGRRQDFIGQDQTRYYFTEIYRSGGTLLERSDTLEAKTRTFSDDELLDMVQEYTFRYFWDYGHPVSGLARERLGSNDVVTTGGSGFGIMAILVGIERGFISRAEGADRLLKIVSFLQISDKFYGVFPHWMNGSTGRVLPFSTYDDGADLVETSFLMQGLLTARSYFDGSSQAEEGLRQSITSLWEGINWNWFRKQNQNVLYWHWSPNYQWRINFPLRGFNETMICYILGAASPTNAIPGSLYETGWAAGNYTNGSSYYGYKLDVGTFRGGPLFFAHYSYLGFDPRFYRDAYTNYFERNRNHTLINRAYCIANPEGHAGYSAESWGLTASDNPWGYLAHEPTSGNDNGTITPTAALSSMPYTPNVSMDALRHFYRDLGPNLWGEYGFKDAFNLDENWFAESYLAIDQGPIICMIENYRTGLLWEHFMSNPEIEPALLSLGFEKDSTTVSNKEILNNEISISIFPNPVEDSFTIFLNHSNASDATIQILNLNGMVLWKKDEQLIQGKNEITLKRPDLIKGNYFLKIKTTDGWAVKPIQIL